jgi:hypothetical protein
MPRDNSGNYTLPAGNPVAPNTVIESTWANPTLADVATTLTQSLDRSGRGTMLASLKLIDGTQSQPSMTFNSETSSGWYRSASHDLRFAVGGVDKIIVNDTGVVFPSTTQTFLAGDGTAAAPSYTFTGQTGTGLFRLAAGGLGLTVAGSQKAGIDGGGQMVLGMTAPTNVAGFTGLNINGTSGSMLNMHANGTYMGRLFADVTTLTLSAAASVPIVFNTPTLERARFTGAAQTEFLLGQTTATSSAAGRTSIAMNGASDSLLFMSSAAVIRGFLLANSSGFLIDSESDLIFQSGAAERARMSSAGVFTYGGFELGFRDLPQNAQSGAAYTAVNADRGKTVVMTGASGAIFTIPQPGAGGAAGMVPGCVVTVINSSSNQGPISLQRNGGTTAIYWGTGPSRVEGNRSLAYLGEATFYLIGGATWLLTGTGIS